MRMGVGVGVASTSVARTQGLQGLWRTGEADSTAQLSQTISDLLILYVLFTIWLSNFRFASLDFYICPDQTLTTLGILI